ncbi:flavoprotein [Streptomyces sp. NBC_00078]|uniref:flavoprotein n=1 Tax=unclassified Streptomyces TaxID=2593676 RepID=UPI00225687F8|nr:flavoprotein [Streptomyces sp. NBC_00078]MCX5421898.1 flavoprotein [Streptomyces sp. NBC_00078]
MSTPAPEFTGERLIVMATGGIQTTLLPTWLDWLRTHYPATQVRCVLTPSALRFTTPLACSVFSGGRPPFTDTWDQDIDHAVHVELAEWSDGIIVHPATFHTVARLALGITDTPMTLALQCTSAPVVICPALPPGGADSHAYRSHAATLAERSYTTVLSPTQGVSAATGQTQIGTAAFFPHALTALQDLKETL